MQFCSSKSMTLTCRAPVYLFLLSPNKIYHNIGKYYKRGKKHVTRSRLLCRIVIRILMSPVATAVLQLRQWSEENWPVCNTNETSLQLVQFSLVQIKTPTYLNVFHSERVRDDHGVDPIFVPTRRQSVLLFWQSKEIGSNDLTGLFMDKSSTYNLSRTTLPWTITLNDRWIPPPPP